MERIIIREVDNTSNVEALSSYDVAYVPGFSNGPQDGSDMSTLYRTPTLVRDKYEFVQKFGASTPVFATDQNYPKQSAGTAGFTEDAIKWGDMSVSYTALTTNFFGSIANAVDSGYYNQVTVVPISIDSGTTYYSVANYQGSYTLQKLTGTESDIIAAILDIVGKTYYTLRYDTLPEGQTIFNPDVDYYEGPDEDSDSDVDLTFTLTTDTEPQSNKTYYTLSDIQVFSDSVFYPDGTYFEYGVDDDGNPEYFETTDTEPERGSTDKWCLSSTINPTNKGWYEKTTSSGVDTYSLTDDTYIYDNVKYYEKDDGIPNMFDTGDADPGYRYAYMLLSMGMPVYYEQMNSSMDDINIESIYSGLTNRFVADPQDPDYSFDTIGDYAVKFITSGGYPTFEYGGNGIAEAMMELAAKRGDAIALIDHTDNPSRNITTYDEDSVITAVRDWNANDTFNHGAMFTPWYECSNPVVTTDQLTNVTFNNVTMPGSLAYLSSLCVQLLNYNPWLAVSGVTRGKVPYLVKLHTDKPLTNNIADTYQILPNENAGAGAQKISINPITYIRNYGYCIWGNRTLRNNANGTIASSFLNIRSAVSDIKKRLYETSQQLLFDQNTDVLWVNFKSLITPLLETMKSDYILSDYAVTRLYVDPATGADVPAYEVMAVIRIQPINSVEVFDLTVYMENSDEFNITTSENEL